MGYSDLRPHFELGTGTYLWSLCVPWHWTRAPGTPTIHPVNRKPSKKSLVEMNMLPLKIKIVTKTSLIFLLKYFSSVQLFILASYLLINLDSTWSLLLCCICETQYKTFFIKQVLIAPNLFTAVLTAGTSCSQYKIYTGMPWQDWNK